MRYIKIDKNELQVDSDTLSRTRVRLPKETTDAKFIELDSTWDDYLSTEITVNEDFTVSKNTTAYNERVERERIKNLHEAICSPKSFILAWYKEVVDGDSTLLDTIKSDIADAIAEFGEP